MTEHVKAWWFDNEHGLPDGSYIDHHGDVGYIKNGKLHREDGPAIEWADGDKDWYKNGKCHREDGPAVERADGYTAWYIDDKLHRKDGPAVKKANNYNEWWIDGKQYKTKIAYGKALKIWKMNEAMK